MKLSLGFIIFAAILTTAICPTPPGYPEPPEEIKNMRRRLDQLNASQNATTKPPPPVSIDVTNEVSWISGSEEYIPFDAVVAFHLYNKPIYVGRAEREGAMLPALVLWENQGAFINYDQKLYRIGSYDILRSSNATWLPIRKFKLPRRALQIGKTTTGDRLYMGKIPGRQLSFMILRTYDDAIFCVSYIDGHEHFCEDNFVALSIR